MALHVHRTGRTWSVFAEPGNDGTAQEELVEGGFFDLAAACRARDHWEQELLQDQVEKAERKAGWDPNP